MILDLKQQLTLEWWPRNWSLQSLIPILKLMIYI